MFEISPFTVLPHENTSFKTPRFGFHVVCLFLYVLQLWTHITNNYVTANDSGAVVQWRPVLNHILLCNVIQYCINNVEKNESFLNMYCYDYVAYFKALQIFSV